MHVHPNFEWIGSLRPPSWMTLLLIRWAVDNVHMAAGGLPPRPAGCQSKMLVGICDTAVMFHLEVVLNGAWSGIAPQPELLDKLLALRIGRHVLERRSFVIGNDVDHVLIQPFDVR